MKTIIFALLVLTPYLAGSQEIKKGVIEFRGKAGNGAGFIDKIDENYLFYSANPVSAIDFLSLDFPSLYLLNKDLTEKQSIDLKKEFKEMELKDSRFEQLLSFGGKLYVIISEEFKKEKLHTFTLYELNKNSLQVFTGKPIQIYSYNSKYTKYHKVLYSISDDKSKLAITISLVSDIMKENPNGVLAHTVVYDHTMKKMYANSISDEDVKHVKNEKIYNQQVANNGNVCLLSNYVGGKRTGPGYLNIPVYTSQAHFIKNNGSSKPVRIDFPDLVLVPGGAKLNMNNNYVVITGMPSIFEKGSYAVFGYFNAIIDEEGNLVKLNILPFQAYFSNTLQLKNKDNIEYESTILLDDGSFFMISHIFTGDRYTNMIASNDLHAGKYIIISYMDKTGKVKWMKNINRDGISPFNAINCLYRKSTGELTVFYDSRRSNNHNQVGLYYNTIDTQGSISEDTKILDNRNLLSSNRIPLENEIILFNEEKSSLECASIKFK